MDAETGRSAGGEHLKKGENEMLLLIGCFGLAVWLVLAMAEEETLEECSRRQNASGRTL